jgi:hypothetical protein
MRCTRRRRPLHLTYLFISLEFCTWADGSAIERGKFLAVHLDDARHADAADADKVDGADFIRQFHGFKKSPARAAHRPRLMSARE